MRLLRNMFLVFLFAESLIARVGETQAQSPVTVPLRGVGHSYFEQLGIGWSVRQQNSGGYWFFNNGGPGPIPPFGGFDANSQASFGWGGRSGDVSWSFGIVAGQGSSQSLGSQSPSLVLPHGGVGVFWNGIQQPFVTGIVPVVGGYPISPVRDRLLRMQYEQLAVQQTKDATEPSSDMAEPDPPAPKPRRDDPPLVLKGD